MSNSITCQNDLGSASGSVSENKGEADQQNTVSTGSATAVSPDSDKKKDSEVFKMPLPGNKLVGKNNVFSKPVAKSQTEICDESSENQIDNVATAESPLTENKLDIKENKESKNDQDTINLATEGSNSQSQKSSAQYTEPKWGGLPSTKFSFEVIKNGTIIDNVDLSVKSCHMFGRLPSCDVALEHPSLSRYHAVVQYCVEKNDKHDIGWYLYDLDSTHGTWVNKIKVKPRTFTRIRVGYVVKFGGSTRLFNLQGPSEDEDEESELSVTELKEQRNRQKLEAEILKLADIEEMQKKELTLLKAKEEEGCSWGIGADELEVESQSLVAAKPEHEDLYIEDPKKGLRGFFEREGLELPEYELQELGRGKHLCRVELPLDSPTGEPVYAEATTTGKKKDAVIACALEACRLLDRHGELRKATHESRRKKAKNWEEDDYYGSDDDDFVDRTGDIEKKRQQRMKRFGKKKEKGLTYDQIVAKLETINGEIDTIQAKLDEAKKQAASYEDADGGIDALDAFMENIKSGAMDTKTKMSLKRQIFELKQEKAKLEKLANIAKPSLPALAKPKTDDKKLAIMTGKIKAPSVRPPRAPIGPARPPVPVSSEDVVEEEEESEDEEEDKKISPDVTKPTETGSNNDKNIDKKDSVQSESDTLTSKKALDAPTKSRDEYVDVPVSRDVSIETQESKTESLNDSKFSNKDNEKKTVDSEKKTVDKVDNSESKLSTGSTAMETEEKPVKQSKKSKQRPTQDFLPAKKPKLKVPQKDPKLGKDYDASDPDYAVWMPPTGQTGDGKTSLNEKYGY